MATSLAEVFGKRLRARREQVGLTQAEAAREVGVASEAYGRLERGYALPRAQTLVSLARLLGTSTDELLGIGDGGARHSALLATVGPPKGGYRASAAPELRRLLKRLEGMEPSEIRIFAQLAALVAAKKEAKKERRKK